MMTIRWRNRFLSRSDPFCDYVYIWQIFMDVDLTAFTDLMGFMYLKDFIDLMLFIDMLDFIDLMGLIDLT